MGYMSRKALKLLLTITATISENRQYWPWAKRPLENNNHISGNENLTIKHLAEYVNSPSILLDICNTDPLNLTFPLVSV